MQVYLSAPSHKTANAMKSKIEKFADFFISTSPEEIRCKDHEFSFEEGGQICEKCQFLKEKCINL